MSYATLSSPLNAGEEDYTRNSYGSLSDIDGNTNYNRLHVYHRRWYMLFLYCLANSICEAYEFSIATVQDKAIEYYNVTDFAVSSLVMISFSMTCVCAFVAAFLAEKFGLYVIHILGLGFLTVGSWIRFFGFDSDLFILVIISQVFYGVGFSCIVETTVTQLSNNWFPEKERATANAIVFISMVFGTTAIELIGPAVIKGNVEDPFAENVASQAVLRSINSNDNYDALREQFFYFFLVQALLCTFVGIVSAITFQGEPPKPPNFSALLKKNTESAVANPKKFARVLLECLKSKPFYPLLLGYGILYGATEALLTVMNPMLIPEGYSTKQAGYCGFAFFGVGFFGAFVAAAIADRTKKYQLVLRLSSFGVFATAMGIYFSFKPDNFVGIFVTMSIHSVFTNAMAAVTFDAMVEVTYPINETVSATITAVVGCVATVVLTNVFLALKSDTYPYSMKNALLCYLILIAVSFLFFLFQFGSYKRLETETEESTKSETIYHSEGAQSTDESFSSSLEDGDIEEIIIESEEDEFDQTYDEEPHSLAPL